MSHEDMLDAWLDIVAEVGNEFEIEARRQFEEKFATVEGHERMRPSDKEALFGWFLGGFVMGGSYAATKKVGREYSDEAAEAYKAVKEFRDGRN